MTGAPRTEALASYVANFAPGRMRESEMAATRRIVSSIGRSYTSLQRASLKVVGKGDPRVGRALTCGAGEGQKGVR